LSIGHVLNFDIVPGSLSWLCGGGARTLVEPRGGVLRDLINEARLSHLPFWGPSEAFFFLIKRPSG